MITQIQKDALNEYAELKKEIKRLEEKAELLNPAVLEIMQENQVEEIAIGDFGKLSMASRRSWIYPEAVKELEDTLKAKKKESEQIGSADYTEKFYVVFKGNKDVEL